MDGEGAGLEERDEYLHVVSMTFESEEEGFQLYNEYVKVKGFSVRKEEVKYLPGTRTRFRRLYTCFKEGHRSLANFETPDPKRTPKSLTRCGCTVHLEIELSAWQKQLSSLQSSLVPAKKNLVSDDMITRAARTDTTPTLAQYDSEDTMSTGTHTLEGTKLKYQNNNPEARVVTGNSDMRINAYHLAKEFEDRRQVFDDDAGFLVVVKSGQIGSNMNPDDELRKLKDRFATWKKDYKSRLKETKVNLHKVSSRDEKSRKRWWGKKSSK